MADINSPREFLKELLDITDSLAADKASLNECSEKKKELASLLASMKNSIEKEKTRTVNDRRSDIEAGFDKQLKTANAELKAANDKRQKALNEGMKARTKEATKDVRQEADAFKNALKAYAGTNKLPAVLKSRMYYRIFCPGIFGYILYLALFLLIMFFAGSMMKQRAAAGLSTAPFFIIGTAAIALLFIYIMIWSNTRVRYRDEIKNCLNIINSIKSSEKQAKNIEKNIKKAGDDSTYDLGKFDEEIAQLNNNKAALEARKAEAINEFEASTRDRLTADIDANYKERLDEKQAEIDKNAGELKALGEKITSAETLINREFVSYVGAKNLTHERISAMLDMIDNGSASSVSEAVSALEQNGSRI